MKICLVGAGTDRRDEAHSHFSQFCKCAYRWRQQIPLKPW